METKLNRSPTDPERVQLLRLDGPHEGDTARGDTAAVHGGTAAHEGGERQQGEEAIAPCWPQAVTTLNIKLIPYLGDTETACYANQFA